MIFSPCITLNRHGHVSWRPPPCFLPGASRPLRTCRQRLASRHIFRHSSFTRIPGRCRSHDSVGCFPVFFVFFCCCGGCDTMTIYIISWILMRVGTICVCVSVFWHVLDLAFLNLSDAVGRQAPPHQIQQFQGLGPATWNHPQRSNAAQEPQNSQLAEGLCFSIHGVSTLGCF